LPQVENALAVVSTDAKEKAYQAWLGYYNSAKMLAMDKKELVRLANFFSYTLGMDQPPILMKKTIGMMGLRGVPGLRSQ
jgi:ATP-dependent RNA helicase MSS116